jgi:hypothetical protein
MLTPPDSGLRLLINRLSGPGETGYEIVVLRGEMSVPNCEIHRLRYENETSDKCREIVYNEWLIFQSKIDARKEDESWPLCVSWPPNRPNSRPAVKFVSRGDNSWWAVVSKSGFLYEEFHDPYDAFEHANELASLVDTVDEAYEIEAADTWTKEDNDD